MKFLHIFLFGTFIFTTAAFAQQTSSAKWTRIEAEDISVAVPPGFIVNTEKKNVGPDVAGGGFHNGAIIGPDVTIYSYQDGSKIHFLIDKGDGKKRFRQLWLPPYNNVQTFTIGDFLGMQLVSHESAKFFHHSLHLASGNGYYTIFIEAENKDSDVVKRFLNSILLEGKPFLAQNEWQTYEEEIVSAFTIKSSPEVLEALERKSKPSKIKVKYELGSDQNSLDKQKYSRPAIIIDQPPPRFNFLYLRGGTAPNNRFIEARMRVNMLANGQIGEITVLSSTDKQYTKVWIDSLKRMKFIPAQIDGKNVDSVRFVNFSISKM